MTSHTPIFILIAVALGLIGLVIVMSTLATLMGQPAFPASSTYANQAALATVCNALDNGWWDFTAGTFTSANVKLDDTLCVPAQRFAGVIPLLQVLPLAAVGGGIFLATRMFRGRA